MLPCWSITEMKALVVFCVLMNEFVSTTELSALTVTDHTVPINCANNSVIKGVEVTCDHVKCLQGECTNKTTSMISKDCLWKKDCILNLPDCLYQYSHINLSYICHKYPVIFCNFESDFCDWNFGGFEIIKAMNTIPKVDYTTGKDYGHLLYSKKNESFLWSPSIYRNQTVCLTFSYILSTNTRIDIYNTISNGFDSKKNVSVGSVSYSEQTNLRSLWKTFKRTVYNIFSILLITILNNKDTAFVAIDDIDVVPGKCEEMLQQEKNFENIVNSGTVFQAGVANLCPTTDYTTFSEQGHYLVVSDNITDNVITFYNLTANTTVCLRFWYKSTGYTELSVQVNLDTNIKNIRFPLLNQINGWSMQFKKLRTMSSKISFYFQRLTTDEGCLAVDDISLSTGYCADRHVNEWFQDGVNQLKCPFVNIPEKRINILTQQKKKNDADETDCQSFSSTLETNIFKICRGTYYEICKINRDDVISNDVCFTQLEERSRTVDVNYSCADMTRHQTTEATSGHSFVTTDKNSDMTRYQTTEATSGHSYVTTDKNSGEVSASSLDSSGNTGLIVGVVVSLLLVCIVVLSLFLFRNRFSFLKTKLCGEDNPGLNMRARESRDVQEYDYLENRKSKDHVYDTASDHINNTTSDHVYNIPSDKDLDGVVYTSIDYEPPPTTISYKEVNTTPNKVLPNERKMFIKSTSKDVGERSPQAVSHPAYAVFDPSVTGFNHREKSEKETVCLSNDKKAELDNYNNSDPQKPNSTGKLSDNYSILDPHETGFDRSKSTSAHTCDLPDDYSVLDPSITGFDRTYEKETTTETDNGDEYAVLDPNETGFQNSVQIDEDIEGNGCYTILDPTETGFDRSNTIKNDGIFNKNDVYELAKPLPTQSEYEICPKEGNYDILGSERETSMDEEHIYNHAPDTVYDTTSHVRAKDRDEETYDHFIGHS